MSKFFVMDGRARWDVDRAIVLTCADTMREAKQDLREQGGDGVIVDAETWGIVYDPCPSMKDDPMCKAIWGKP